MTAVEHWETLDHRSTVRALARRSPFHAVAQNDLTARGVVLLAVAAVSAFAGVDVLLRHDLGYAFGVFFVLVSATSALAVDVRALFAPAVLPPLLMVAVVTVVSCAAPEAIDVDGLAAGAGTMQRAIAGIIDHATALVLGHLLALAIVGFRIWSAPRTRHHDDVIENEVQEPRFS